MSYCEKCGIQIDESVKFCPSCGTASQITNTENTTSPENDIETNKVMALLSYFGILVLAPILAAKESPFARFHANQGLLLTIAMFLYILADGILTVILRAILWKGLGLWSVYSLCGTLLNLLYVGFTVLAIIGIINVLNGRTKELPIIGKYRILK